ncbi:hypothetical protein CTEN210_06589 [Chaetoceros tenuissimus]|uniref:Non-specific serine/threonine protein kinase n=1 Tax=Chaetoceros tenuissimus TaxID=426638 RepID=A0AAD3CQN5_9STRA|nr:hypothetical protein CTEN210_06589 [Chaetoceros tenuissimus]
MKITISDEEWEAIGREGPGVRMYRGLKTYFYNGEELWNLASEKHIVHTDAERQSWQQLIILPGVEEVRDHTFTGCANVEIVFMHDSTKKMGKYCFYRLVKLSFVQFSRELESIGAYALGYCGLIWSLFIPSTCRQICDHAFTGCNMLIVLRVHHDTELGNRIIEDTALLSASPFAKVPRSETSDDNQVNEWIKNRHNSFPIHQICCSENPSFSKALVNRYNCHQQDGSGLTALHYLVINPFSDFETVKSMVQICGPELLNTVDSTCKNVLQYACLMNDVPLQMLFAKKELETITEKEKKVPLNRSTVTFVGQGRSGKTSTINSLKGSGFQPHCPSTRGSRTYIRDFGMIRDSNIKASNTFRQKEKGAKLTTRSLCMRSLDETTTDCEQCHLYEEECSCRGLVESMHEFNRESVSKLRFIQFGKDEDACHQPNSLLDSEQTGNVRIESGRHIESSFGNHKSDSSNGNDSDDNSDASDDDDEELAFIYSMKHTCEHLINCSCGLESIMEGSTMSGSRKESLKDITSIHKEDIRAGEESTVKNVDDMHLMNSKDGTSIRFTIFDNGGQTVFRGIQNLFFSREGIFIVVFDMMKILNEDTKQESLEHLQYWFSSINLDASKDDFSLDPSINYPPVILVGTHYDDLLETGDQDSTPSSSLEKLDDIDRILNENLDLGSLFPIPSTLISSTSTTNETCGFSFWPIDNSNPRDKNILKLRQLLLDTALKDKGCDMLQEVPISMLQTMDKLTEISKDNPIISINPKKNGDVSVLEVMSQCGVFDEENYYRGGKEEICKSLLKQFHNIGQCLYFHQIPALRDYCILDPQWLINAIAYVVRDFRIHWFLRDDYAIELNDGSSWNRLKNDGVLDVSLLRRLWLGYEEHFVFLQRVMIEIGIFGKCKDCFIVPILQTHSSKDSLQDSNDILSDYVEIGNIEFEEHGFAITSFYCQLVNALIEGRCEPLLLHSACVFRFQEEKQLCALLLDTIDMKIKVLFHPNGSKGSMQAMLMNIQNKCECINEFFYRRKLVFSFNMLTEVLDGALDENAQDMYRDGTGSTRTFEIDYKNYVFKEIKTDLSTLKFQNPRLNEIAEKMQGYNMTIPALRNAYYYIYNGDDENFKAEILRAELALNSIEQKTILKYLKEQKKPPPAEKMMVACMESSTCNAEKEQNIIQHQLIHANYEAFFVSEEGGYFKTRNIYEDNETLKILHCAGHKGKLEDTDICVVFKDDNCKRQVECVVLNNCKSEEITNAAKKHFENSFIVYWDSRVRNEAAIRFAEEFYSRLCDAAYKGVHMTFKEVFEKTKKSMEDHNFVFQDPDGKGENTYSSKNLVAGILKCIEGKEGLSLVLDDDCLSPNPKRPRLTASPQSVTENINSRPHFSPYSKNEVPHKCYLNCSYSFACKRKQIETNCQFIKYNNVHDPSLDDIDEVCKRDPSKGKKALKQCPDCSFIFCDKSGKIPSENEFISCYDAHKKNCQPGSIPNVHIDIPKKCKDCILSIPQKGAFVHCPTCKREAKRDLEEALGNDALMQDF